MFRANSIASRSGQDTQESQLLKPVNVATPNVLEQRTKVKAKEFSESGQDAKDSQLLKQTVNVAIPKSHPTTYESQADSIH